MTEAEKRETINTCYKKAVSCAEAQDWGGVAFFQSYLGYYERLMPAGELKDLLQGYLDDLKARLNGRV